MSVRISRGNPVRKIVCWGATGQSKVIHEALSGSDARFILLVDSRDVPPSVADVPLVVGMEALDAWLEEHDASDQLHAVVAIGGGAGRDRLQLMASLRERGLPLLTVVHPTAFVARDAHIGSGCQILAMAAVCTHVQMGAGVIVNTSASVDHDCCLGDGVHIAPGARLAGEVVVGDRAFIGTGAIVLPRLRIGNDTVVGAGAVVTKDVAPGATVVGNPARPHLDQA